MFKNLKSQNSNIPLLYPNYDSTHSYSFYQLSANLHEKKVNILLLTNKVDAILEKTQPKWFVKWKHQYYRSRNSASLDRLTRMFEFCFSNHGSASDLPRLKILMFIPGYSSVTQMLNELHLQTFKEGPKPKELWCTKSPMISSKYQSN